jgi:hypothetical protein
LEQATFERQRELLAWRVDRVAVANDEVEIRTRSP